MTATFQNWGMSYDWAWFTATIIGILVIALPLMLAVAMIIYAERKIWAAIALRRVLLLEFEGRGVAACGTCERMGHERGLFRQRADHADRHGARAMWTGCRRVGL